MDTRKDEELCMETSHILPRHDVSRFIKVPKVPSLKTSGHGTYTSTYGEDSNTTFQYSLPEISHFRGFGHSPWSFRKNNAYTLLNPPNNPRKSLANEATLLLPLNNLSTSKDNLPTDNNQENNQEPNEEQRKTRRSAVISKLLAALDMAITFLWIGPLVSAYWYSTWILCDRYFFVNNLEVSYWFSATLGSIIITVATLIQDNVLEFSSNRRKITRYILMRVFSYIMSVANINQWRGVWDLEDYYAGINVLSAAVMYCLPTLVLFLLRGHRSVLYSPTTVSVDVNHCCHYKMATFLSVTPGWSRQFLLDTAFTVFVFEPITISVWRGLWVLVDVLLYPNNKQNRALWCLVGSYALSFVLAILQVPIRRFAGYLEKVSWYLMLAFEDVITALYVVFTIISWRGIWLVLEIYTPQETGFIWLYHYLSFGLLVLGLCANSAVTQVGLRDGAIPNGQGAILELLYIRSILVHQH